MHNMHFFLLLPLVLLVFWQITNKTLKVHNAIHYIRLQFYR